MLVNDLKAAGIGVWGLSNWEKELFPIALKHCEILQRLDGRLVSGYVHMRKPHKDIYEKAWRSSASAPKAAYSSTTRR